MTKNSERLGLPRFTYAELPAYGDLSSFNLSPEDLETRKHYIGGSDAKIIAGNDEARLLELWKEKTSHEQRKAATKTLNMYLGNATEALNAAWYMSQTGDCVIHPQATVTRDYDGVPIRATLDGICKEGKAIWEAKHVSGYDFVTKEKRTVETVAAEYYAQLQHNMLVTNMELSVLSVLFDTNRHEHMVIEADPFYQDSLAVSEDMFWTCVLNKTPPSPLPIPSPKVKAFRVVDMSTSKDWEQAAKDWLAYRDMARLFDKAAADIKSLMDADTLKAIGHGVSASRDKRGSVRIVPLSKTDGGEDADE